jgi:hypothetical protein
VIEDMGMNEIPVQDRSYAPIEDNHLLRLAELAREEREYFFASWPRWQRLYADRRLCVALCQGAALHYVDGRNGVKDFDVWTFYTEHPERPFPPRRYYKRYYPFRDFGPSLFGRHPADVGWTGRKVDLLARSLACDIGADAVAVL